ncbi:MAG: YbaY family lipoprotein [Steroidobacteraceae bacterium]
MDLHTNARIATRAAALVLAALVTGCTLPASPPMASVTGTATYRERMALPPDATFEASIEDVSRADAPAVTVASARIDAPGAPPFRFTIAYDPARIEPSHRYAIRARVTHGEQLLFTTATHVPLPMGPDAAPVSLMMVRAGARADAPAQAGPPTAVAGWMRGEYRYLADAGTFTDCATGQRVPVAQALDNAALEAAYSKARVEPGAPLLATLVGRIETRAGAEGDPRPALSVEHFIRVTAATCDNPGVPALEDTYWGLARIDAVPVALAPGQRAPYIVLASAKHRVGGFAGCNRLTGGYALDGRQLSFTQMAGTMMACAQGMELEQQFHAALARVAGWRLEANGLALLDAQGHAVAEFIGR